MKACFDPLLNGPILALRLLPALLLAAGCASHTVDAQRDPDAPYQPRNVYLKSKTLEPQLRRVAVLPVTTAAPTETFSAGAQVLQHSVSDELQKTRLFDLVAVSPEQLRQWTGQSSWRDDEPLPQDFFTRLREGSGCDAVFFSHLTSYYPYPPVAVGWKLTLVEIAGGQIIWKADDLFNAGDATVANAARRYSSEQVHIEGPADDPAVILGSPSRFGQYSLSALMATLPHR